jgi:hypothetical protein
MDTKSDEDRICKLQIHEYRCKYQQNKCHHIAVRMTKNNHKQLQVFVEYNWHSNMLFKEMQNGRACCGGYRFLTKLKVYLHDLVQ